MPGLGAPRPCEAEEGSPVRPVAARGPPGGEARLSSALSAAGGVDTPPPLPGTPASRASRKAGSLLSPQAPWCCPSEVPGPGQRGPPRECAPPRVDPEGRPGPCPTGADAVQGTAVTSAVVGRTRTPPAGLAMGPSVPPKALTLTVSSEPGGKGLQSGWQWRRHQTKSLKRQKRR